MRLIVLERGKIQLQTAKSYQTAELFSSRSLEEAFAFVESDVNVHYSQSHCPRFVSASLVQTKSQVILS